MAITLVTTPIILNCHPQITIIYIGGMFTIPSHGRCMTLFYHVWHPHDMYGYHGNMGESESVNQDEVKTNDVQKVGLSHLTLQSHQEKICCPSCVWKERCFDRFDPPPASRAGESEAGRNRRCLHVFTTKYGGKSIEIIYINGIIWY